MFRLFTVLFLLFPIALQAQLNCTSTTQKDGSTTRLCFHKNGNIATNETWDEGKRNGSIKGFNAKGQEIFYYSLRTYGGHASVSLRYYENGQVSRVHYSQAPDGGIQFDDETLKFDEEGNLTNKQSNKFPYETKTSLPKKYQEQNAPKTQYKQEEVREAALHTDIFTVENQTNKKLIVHIQSIPQIQYLNKNLKLELNPKEKKQFDYIPNAGKNIEQLLYKMELLPQNEKYSIDILIQENKKLRKKNWTWIIKEK